MTNYRKLNRNLRIERAHDSIRRLIICCDDKNIIRRFQAELMSLIVRSRVIGSTDDATGVGR